MPGARGDEVAFGRTQASAMLDLLRGLAALLVCVSHWRNLFFVDYAQAGHEWLVVPFYLVTACGRQSVMVFFVLSGYLIAGSVRRANAAGEFHWQDYAVQRLTRLWVVLVPGLLLCAACDWVGMRSGWAPRLYGGLSGDHLILNVARDYNLAALGRTIFFLQGITGRVFGSDGPLWSVGYEAWYYVMFPLGLLAFVSRGWVRAALAVALVAVAAVQGREMLALSPVWLAGAALTLLPKAKVGARLRWVAAGVYVPLFSLAGKSGRLAPAPASGLGLLTDFALGLATMGLIWVLLSARQEQTGATWERVGRATARFSYTLYVVHVPMLVLLAAWAGRDQRWQPDARHLLVATGLLGVVLGLAWVVAWATEFRTDWVRISCYQLLERTRSRQNIVGG